MGRGFGILVLAIVAGVAAEEEAMQSAANVGISVMLLGSVGFMMGLFYLVSQKDADMRKYSWQTISSTISIFSAVLLFQAVNGLVEHYVTKGASEEFELLFAFVHMLLWFALLQFVLAVISGAVGKPPEKEDEEEWENMELMLKCWAVLLGHITGFAAINAFTLLQQMVPKSVFATFLVAPFAWVCVFLLSICTKQMRDYVALSDDGAYDDAEIKWDEETKETENDIIGLAVSFVLAQTLRFAISGDLPDQEGNEPDAMLSNHPSSQVLMLIGIATLFTILNVLRTLYIKKVIPGFTPQMRNVVMMDTAWCFFFSSDWWLSTNFFATEHGMIKEVVLALFVTAVAFIMIFFLDKVADAMKNSAANKKSETEEAIRAMVQAYGILIGFSWEKAFDKATESCTGAMTSVSPAWGKLFMSIALAAVVIPAWRMHILPTIMEYEKAEEEEEKEEEEEAKDVEKPKVSQTLDKPLLIADGLAGPPEADQKSNHSKANLQRGKSHKTMFVGLTAKELKKELIKEMQSHAGHSEILEELKSWKEKHSQHVCQIKELESQVTAHSTALENQKKELEAHVTHKKALQKRNLELEAHVTHIKTLEKRNLELEAVINQPNESQKKMGNSEDLDTTRARKSQSPGPSFVSARPQPAVPKTMMTPSSNGRHIYAAQYAAPSLPQPTRDIPRPPPHGFTQPYPPQNMVYRR